jgi:nitrite reductase (NO-forming)
MHFDFKRSWLALVLILVTALILSGCVGAAFAVGESQFKNEQSQSTSQVATSQASTPQAAPTGESSNPPPAGEPTVSFTLKTGLAYEKMSFTGVGGDIDGQVNPDLRVQPGDVVEIILLNDDGVQHNIAIDEFGVKSEDVMQRGQGRIVFTADQEGTAVYYCAIPGHWAPAWKAAIVGQPSEPILAICRISRAPDDRQDHGVALSDWSVRFGDH